MATTKTVCKKILNECEKEKSKWRFGRRKSHKENIKKIRYINKVLKECKIKIGYTS